MLDSAKTVPVEDQIADLTAAIKAATEKGQWPIVRDLSRTLNQLLVEQRRHMPFKQRQGISSSNAKTQAKYAMEERRPGAELLVAISQDPRFGSLREYCRQRFISRSSLSSYLSGGAPCPRSVDIVVRKDFPKLDFEWPGGVSH